MKNLFINTDNVVSWVGMKDAETGQWINDDVDSVLMTLCHKEIFDLSSFADEAVSEVQTLVPDFIATGGNYTLSFEGYTTANIAHNASVSAVKTALETLTSVDADDIVVSGNPLSSAPVLGGMIFTFADKLGDVDMIEFDLSGLTGPSQEGSTIIETTKGIMTGDVVDEPASAISFPLPNNGIDIESFIRIEGSNEDDYNDQHYVIKVKKNRVHVVEGYTVERFTGNEQIYLAVEDGTNIALNYVAASDGIHRGILPDTLKRLRIYDSRQTVSAGLYETGLFYLFITAIKAASKTTKRIPMQAVYDET